MVTRYRPRPGIRDNLIDLYRETLQTQLSDDLGLSSLARGRGFIEFHDGTTVVAQLGDQPDGGFGVAVRHRGNLTDVTQIFTAVEDTADGQGTRLGSLENEIGNARGDYNTLAGRIYSDTSRINGLRSEVDNARGGHGTLAGRLNDHASRLGSAENRLDGHGTRLSGVETKNTQQDSRMDGHNSRLSSVEGRNNTQDGRLDAHAQRLGALENRAASLENNYSQLKGRVDQIWNFLEAMYPTFPFP